MISMRWKWQKTVRAKVKYTLHFGNGTESKDDMKLVLDDGKWMIDAGN